LAHFFYVDFWCIDTHNCLTATTQRFLSGVRDC